jgi:pimeloyl-ACP methyl ester carboxylesterase
MKKLLVILLGAAAGVGATTAALVLLGNRRVDRWETLTLDDAREGDFVTLSDGTRMHYIERAPSSAVLRPSASVILIHGLMDSAEQWRANMDALASAHRVFAVDLMGFGFSSRVTAPVYSMKRLARSIREFMDAQGIPRASIVGHSLGGAVALEFAHDFPERVEKLVLIAPATYLLQWRPELRWARQLPFVPRALIGWTLTSRRARGRALRDALGDPARFDAAELARRIRPLRVRGTADALVAMLESPHHSDLPQDLARVTAPTLIVWGEKDRAVPRRHGTYHARALPHARLVVIENAGHLPQYEYPDQVNRLILEFLDAAGEDFAHIKKT